jgi:broad specificity phosphatase PhoE
MAIIIVFEFHGTTYDNEQHLASGWFDVELSESGIKQAKEMGERYSNDHFSAIYCSDLRRSYRSAEIAFSNKFPIIIDSRLKECNYGDLTHNLNEQIEFEKPKRIRTPFPNGESYEQTTVRIKSFLQDLIKEYNGSKVMIVGHRATQYGLEHLIRKIPLKEIIKKPWSWQPGWKYILTSL